MVVRLDTLSALGLTTADWPANEAEVLLNAAAPLGPRARQLLIQIAQRLAIGAAEHGDFDPSRVRDLKRETLDELLDATVYLSCALQKQPTQALPQKAECDDLGFGPDGMPWLPPAGTRVRVVARWYGSNSQIGDFGIVKSAIAFNGQEARIWFCNEYGDRHIRVVPAPYVPRVVCPRDRMPRKGERVRVIEVSSDDLDPAHCVGDTGVLFGRGAWPSISGRTKDYLILGTPGNGGGIAGTGPSKQATYCKVEIVPE